MGGQVDPNEANPNYAGDEGITATERSLEGLVEPQRLASGGQARGPRRPAPTPEERAALYTRLEQQYDLPDGYLARVRQIESSDGTRLFNRNSRAAGPFQFIPRTATAMGLRDPYDEIASAEAAARLAAENAQALRRRGFEIDAPTLYLAHQQGATGAVRLLQGNQPAVDIVGRNAVLWNAGNENMTGPQFAGRILDSFRGVPAQPAQAAPAQAAAPAEPPAIPRIGALPPVEASAQPPAQAPVQEAAAPPAQAPMPIPFPPPPAPPVPAARQRRADDQTGAMRNVMASLEMQGSGAGQPTPMERHLQMVQQAQRRYATAMPEQEPAMMAEGGLAQARERRTFRDQMRDQMRNIEAEIRGERPASMGVTIARGFGEGGGGLAGIVSPATARAIQMTTRLPQDARFLQAVENTPGARITDDGLQLELLRYQKPEQAGAQAIREGVFYLPATLPSRSVGSYKQSTHDPRQMLYGGPERVRGETLLRAPLAVRGTTGGNVPRTAFLELGGNEEMLRVGPEIEATFRRSAPWGGNRIPTPASYRAVEDWLDARGGNPYVATDLVNNSLRGDQLFWALRENVIGNRARREGYDSIVGTGARKPRLTEVFDLREAAYPVPGVPEFEMLLPQFEARLR